MKAHGILVCLCILLMMIVLTSCQSVVSSPEDEIRLYSWKGESENGNVFSLDFDDDKAELRVKNSEFELVIGGLCMIDDKSFVIFDEDTQENYCFQYLLHGDKIELSYQGGTVVLQKVSDEKNGIIL